MQELTGSVEEIIYYNAENGYAVILMEVANEPVTATGSFPELAPGEVIQVEGEFTTHPRFGDQFKVTRFRRVPPTTADAVERYLGSGLVKGIGPGLAARIVKRFGAESLQVLEQSPDRLREVSGIGPAKIQQIYASWLEQRNVYEVMDLLQTVQVSTRLAIRICKTYGNQAAAIVRENPYRLAVDVRGIGFFTADKIASQLGVTRNSPERTAAGLVHTLRELASEGHTYAPRAALVNQAARLLRLSDAEVDQHLTSISSEEDSAENPSGIIIENWQDEQRVYLNTYLHAEASAARRVRELLAQNGSSRIRSSGLLLPAFLEGQPITAQQRQAVLTALEYPISVLTGGPGTGKSYTLATLIGALDSMSKKYALTAPTGRAARRLAEATGQKASTIHRLLAYTPVDNDDDDLSVFSNSEPLNVDMVVVDEASMVDIMLANRLLQSIPDGCHLLLVGDADQLPSVGAGDFLRDVIDSGVAPVTRLTEVFRQAETSEIIANAHRINRGETPVMENDLDKDFFLFTAESGSAATDRVVSLIEERIPRKFGFGPHQIQVLTPMRKGEAGVQALNERLQSTLNPPSPRKKERLLAGTLFRAGDRVMQIRNEYTKEVFNGDIGIIEEIDDTEAQMIVNIDGRRVEYDFNEADQLVLAYASTIHKSQGSEYPVVIMVLLNEHRVMLARNLLYTGVTRAQKLFILVSSRPVVAAAVAADRGLNRWSGLADRLRLNGESASSS